MESWFDIIKEVKPRVNPLSGNKTFRHEGGEIKDFPSLRQQISSAKEGAGPKDLGVRTAGVASYAKDRAKAALARRKEPKKVSAKTIRSDEKQKEKAAAKVKRKEGREKELQDLRSKREAAATKEKEGRLERDKQRETTRQETIARRKKDAGWKSPYREGTWDTGWRSETGRRKLKPSITDIKEGMGPSGTPKSRWRAKVRSDGPQGQTKTIDEVLQRPSGAIPTATTDAPPEKPHISEMDTKEYQTAMAEYPAKVEAYEKKKEQQTAARAKWEKENPTYAEHGGYKPTQRMADVKREDYMQREFADKQTKKLMADLIQAEKEGLEQRKKETKLWEDLAATRSKELLDRAAEEGQGA